jgi:hypothetical protein
LHYPYTTFRASQPLTHPPVYFDSTLTTSLTNASSRITTSNRKPRESAPVGSFEETAAASSDNEDDYHSTTQPSRRDRCSAASLSRAEEKTRKLAAELASLKDYNKPPETSGFDTQCDDAPRTSGRTHKAAASTRHHHVQGARIIKPTAPRPKKRVCEDKLMEVANLTP